MEMFLEACKGAPKADATEKKKEDKKEPEKRVPKLAELWIDFDNEHIRHQKASTQSGYRSIYRKDLGPLLGKVRADQIAKEHLANLRSRMMERGCVRSSIELAEQKLTACLNWAKERGKLPAMHAIPSLKWPKAEKKKVDVYTEAELEQQIDAAEDLEERVLMLLLVDGAMRIGECAGLQWSDINWDVGMTIQRNVSHCVFQDSPKGEVGTIPLTSRLKEALRELLATRPDVKFVFLPKRGRRAHTTDQALAWIVNKIQVRAGVEVRGPHRIRHSVLTHLAEAGESPYALQALARHSDLQTTLLYYVHVNKLALAKQAIAALEARSSRLGKGQAKLGNVVQMRSKRTFTN
ncbi:tyrosine-type recombinase/integrase [Nannocystis sp. ILAH1]|uniref:tyrosine-type recombinase/integrase n=1 Tax=unclassified Nannocystis TaxID=2627009 RepID=UPI0022713CA5|nr:MULTISPECIES: tyrosine-type recombinase/integrase [unclassified Nannocystis]MCY0992249.1 tyrosine-type recombinase/integrase [Nannocystis sp. ILAH1]MCY1069163.1 tyrosine-type recombinase/integrase [Nannocystis sp. RBIL2]